VKTEVVVMDFMKSAAIILHHNMIAIVHGAVKLAVSSSSGVLFFLFDIYCIRVYDAGKQYLKKTLVC
jgi:hypothetical protein